MDVAEPSLPIARDPAEPPRFEDRHPVISSLIGAVVGAACSFVVLYLLFYLSPFVIHTVPVDLDAKRGFLVELYWFICGMPFSTLLGAMWPHTVGRLFRRSVTPT